MQRVQNHRGLSLAEIMTTILIFSVIAGGIYATMAAGDSSWFVNSVQIEMQQSLRIAMSRIKDDLQQSGPSAVANIPVNSPRDAATYPDPDDDPAYDWYNTITFQKTSGVNNGLISWDANAIQLVLSGTNLQRIYNGTTVVIAQNIQSFNVRRLYATPHIVDVELQAQKVTAKRGTLSDALNFKVYMRN